MSQPKNTISARIADFLKKYPPFYSLEEEELQALSWEVVVIYKEKNQRVFEEGEAPHSHFYVVHKGAVALSLTNDEQVVDICDEGDIFGLRPLMANENYRLKAVAQEESILYALPIEVFKPYAKQNQAVSDFLVESFASNTRNPYSQSYKGQLLGDAVKLSENTAASKLLDLQAVQYSTRVISCTKEQPIQEVAGIMTRHRVGSIVVMEEDLAVGIITDRDIRREIASGNLPISAQAEEIMSAPVITYPPQLTITQAQMAMMKSNISHLILTQDGTPNSAVVGMLSKHDLMLSLGNNPAAMIKAIKRSNRVEELKPIRRSITNLLKGYLEQNIPLTLVSKIIGELNDATSKQVVELSLRKMEKAPPVEFAWLAMGSQGRGEQLLHTDQDNALVFANVEKDRLEGVRSYFLELAGHVTAGLNALGFDYCPADMMASNPKWCLSLNEFEAATRHWITNPGPEEVLLSSIFFDYNRIYGSKNLVDQLSENIYQQTDRFPLFFMHLASGALQSPSPSGFFRSFLLEQDGEHKDSFDLKKRTLMPLIDAARVLILAKRVKGISNTAERYEKMAELEAQNRELFLSCSFAFKALLKFRTKQGLTHNDSGRYIDLKTLNKEEKMKLKRTFKTIKDIQELISVRFMTSRLQ